MEDKTLIQTQETTEAKPPSHMAGVIGLICFILVLPIVFIPFIGIVAGLLFNTAALILGIIAITRKSIVLGVIVIGLSVLIGFPGGCAIGCGNLFASAAIVAAAYDAEMTELEAKLEAAEIAGDAAAIALCTKELEELKAKREKERLERAAKRKSRKSFRDRFDD